VVWSEHVSALDPRLTLIKAWVFFVPESRDLAVSGPEPRCEWPGPHTEGSGTRPRGLVHVRGGPGPYSKVQPIYTGARYFSMGVRTHC
jgi:hypothetical protein